MGTGHQLCIPHNKNRYQISLYNPPILAKHHNVAGVLRLNQ